MNSLYICCGHRLADIHVKYQWGDYRSFATFACDFFDNRPRLLAAVERTSAVRESAFRSARETISARFLHDLFNRRLQGVKVQSGRETRTRTRYDH